MLPFGQVSKLYGRIFEIPVIIVNLKKLMNLGIGILNNIVIFDALPGKYNKRKIKN